MGTTPGVGPVVELQKQFRMSQDRIRRTFHEDPVAWFHEGLRRYDVRGVCIHQTARNFGPIVRILRREGFRMEFEVAMYEIWIRSSDSGAAVAPDFDPPS